jgi:hypothetical protein
VTPQVQMDRRRCCRSRPARRRDGPGDHAAGSQVERGLGGLGRGEEVGGVGPGHISVQIRQPETRAANTVTDGTWVVGSDIVPGTYRVSADVGPSCFGESTRAEPTGGPSSKMTFPAEAVPASHWPPARTSSPHAEAAGKSSNHCRNRRNSGVRRSRGPDTERAAAIRKGLQRPV